MIIANWKCNGSKSMINHWWKEFSKTYNETDNTFVFNFKVENIKIIPGSYEVVVSSKLLSKFQNTQYDLKYFIALEPDSTFG